MQEYSHPSISNEYNCIINLSLNLAIIQRSRCAVVACRGQLEALKTLSYHLVCRFLSWMNCGEYREKGLIPLRYICVNIKLPSLV